MNNVESQLQLQVCQSLATPTHSPAAIFSSPHGTGRSRACSGSRTCSAQPQKRLAMRTRTRTELQPAMPLCSGSQRRAEILETDFWVQYNELGGIPDCEVPGGTGNPVYTEALKILDEDMDQYTSMIIPRMSSPTITSSTHT